MGKEQRLGIIQTIGRQDEDPSGFSRCPASSGRGAGGGVRTTDKPASSRCMALRTVCIVPSKPSVCNSLREAGWSYRQIGREVGLHWTRVGQVLKNSKAE